MFRKLPCPTPRFILGETVGFGVEKLACSSLAGCWERGLGLYVSTPYPEQSLTRLSGRRLHFCQKSYPAPLNQVCFVKCESFFFVNTLIFLMEEKHSTLGTHDFFCFKLILMSSI